MNLEVLLKVEIIVVSTSRILLVLHINYVNSLAKSSLNILEVDLV
jgi:hypothetical protein